MSAQRLPEPDRTGVEPEQGPGWVRVPAVVDGKGDRVVTLLDERGKPQSRLVAELVLEAFVGPRPPGHVVRFIDGDRRNYASSNLEWIPAHDGGRDESSRASAIATRGRADAMRQALEGRRHSDSAALLAEDRLT